MISDTESVANGESNDHVEKSRIAGRKRPEKSQDAKAGSRAYRFGSSAGEADREKEEEVS
jgi:hypothetical protein